MAVLVLLFGATVASAAPIIPPGFDVRFGAGSQGGGPPFNVPPLGPPDFTPVGVPGVGPGAFFVEKTGLTVTCGPPGPPTDCFNLDFNILSDPDPSITIGFTATNLTTSTQVFVFQVSLPIFPTLAGSLTSDGSISATLTDSGSNGATLGSITGIDVYTALYNPSGGGSGTLVSGALFGDPFTFSVGSGLSGSPTPGAFGPVVQVVGDLQEIGIRIEFELSPLDIVGFTGNFFVIPEPGTATLLLTGLILIGLPRRVR